MRKYLRLFLNDFTPEVIVSVCDNVREDVQDFGQELVRKYFNDGDVPQDAWAQDFQYYAPAPDGSPYGIVSLGKDGSEGGDGPDGDINSWELSDETCDW